MVQAERLAAIGQTIAALSHHIKNILQGLQVRQRDPQDGPRTTRTTSSCSKGWKMVEKNQGKIYELVMDMLSYSKEREPAIEPTDINEVVDDVVELLAGGPRRWQRQAGSDAWSDTAASCRSIPKACTAPC